MSKTFIPPIDQVLPLLNGEQTMYIKLMKPQPDDDGLHNHTEFPMSLQSDMQGWWGTVDDTGEHKQFKCPFGKAGDVIGMRETWTVCQTINHIRHSGGRTFSEISDGLYYYKADGCETIQELKAHIRLMSDSSFEGVEAKDNKWHSPVTMPREAIRGWFLVEDVFCKQVQSISEAEAEQMCECNSVAQNDGGDHFDYYKHYGISEKEADGWPWLDTAKKSFQSFVVNRFGLTAWEDNAYMWGAKLKRAHQLNCMVCNKEFYGESPKMCCSGRDCGCMGMPIDPIVCSKECYENLPANRSFKRVKKQ